MEFSCTVHQEREKRSWLGKGSLVLGNRSAHSSTFSRRQIGKMLNAREPKIVNGPQILDKYVGESEANIRKLFAEADEEEKRVMTSQRQLFHA